MNDDADREVGSGVESEGLGVSGAGDRPHLLVKIWEKTVEVQQHFNDIEIRIRSIAITLVLGVVGASGFALKEHIELRVGGTLVSLAIPVLVGGLLGVAGFWFMDRHWYHRLLVGSVKQGMVLESALEAEGLAEAHLTKAIGEESPVEILGWKIHSKGKIDLFYSLLFGALAIMMILAGLPYWMGNATAKKLSASPNPRGILIISREDGLVLVGSEASRCSCEVSWDEAPLVVKGIEEATRLRKERPSVKDTRESGRGVVPKSHE